MLRRRALLAAALLAAASASAEEAAEDEQPIDLGALAAPEGGGGPDLADLADEDEPAEAVLSSPSKAEEEGQDVVDQLAAGSGVRVSTICTNCNAASLSVNGMSGDHVRVTWDGIPAAGGLAAVYYLTQFPGELVGYTGVGRGPGTALSGSAGIAGTIDFHSAARDERRALLDLQLGDWGWRSMKLAGADRWGPVGALVFVQGAKEAEYDANDDGFNEVADFERLTAHGIFDFELTDNQVLTLEGSFYGEDQLRGPGAPDPVAADHFGKPSHYLHEDAFFNWRLFSARWEMTRPSGVRYSFKGRYSRRGHQQWSLIFEDLRDVGFEPINTYFIEDEQSWLDLRAERPVGLSGFLTAGITWSKQRLFVRQARQLVLGGPEWIVDGLEERSGYVQYERSAGARWDFGLGARYDRFEVFGKTYQADDGGWSEDSAIVRSFISPRSHVHFRPRENVVLGFELGRGIVGPRPVFEETCCGARYQRNRELRPERAWSSQASLEWKPNPDMRLTTTLFWTDFEDYHERIVYETQSYIPYYKNENIQDARIRGFDVVHDMRFMGDLFNVGWTYTYTDADGTYTWPGDEDHEPWSVRGLRYVPEHAASAYFRWNDVRLGSSLTFDASWTGSMKHFELEEFFRGEHEPWQFLESDDFLNMSVRFEQRIGKKGWSAYVGVDNITDYVMPDLGEFDSAYDWGPIQGRFVYGGAKFSR